MWYYTFNFTPTSYVLAICFVNNTLFSVWQIKPPPMKPIKTQSFYVVLTPMCVGCRRAAAKENMATTINCPTKRVTKRNEFSAKRTQCCWNPFQDEQSVKRGILRRRTKQWVLFLQETCYTLETISLSRHDYLAEALWLTHWSWQQHICGGFAELADVHFIPTKKHYQRMKKPLYIRHL